MSTCRAMAVAAMQRGGEGGEMTIHLSLGELIASIPAVLGVEPRESVVALSITSEGLPTCAMVVDRQTLLDPDRAAVTAAAVAEELAAVRTQVAVLVTYTAEDVRSRCAALEALRLEVEYVVPRVEALAVAGGAWFRPGCTDESCCPENGRSLPPVPEFAPRLFAEARERAERSDRAFASVQARFEGRALAAAAWEEALAAGGVPDAATARRLAAVLDDLCVRDWVVLTILGADPEAADDALAGHETGSVALALDDALAGARGPDPLVTERARLVVERVARAARGRRRRAATLTLAAVLDWWEGNLERAYERCTGALANDDGYRLAELVRLAASRGIAPGWVRATEQSVG